MAMVANPNSIMTADKGLTLCLDAGSVRSYPTGSVWYDTSASKLTFSSAGTQTTLTTLGGALAFNANSSGYWSCSTNTHLVDLGAECTLIMWLYCSTPSVRRTIFEKAGTSYASYQQEIACTWETNNSISWYSRYNDYDYASTPAMNANTWNMVGIQMTSAKTVAARSGYYSMNGGTWTSGYTPRSTTPVTKSANITIFTGYAGTVDTGGVGMVMAFNRMITNAEVSTVFDQTRKRFGI